MACLILFISKSIPSGGIILIPEQLEAAVSIGKN